MIRTLVLIRHAKAEKAHPGGDHERELAERGVVDAKALGRWLAEEELTPDLVLVSTATRTRQTADHVLGGAGADAEQWPSRGLYDGGPEGVLDAVREVPEDAQVVWVVGHEPSMSMLTLSLADEAASSAAALDVVREHFATSTAAVLLLDGGWAGLGEGGARLAAVHSAHA